METLVSWSMGSGWWLHVLVGIDARFRDEFYSKLGCRSDPLYVGLPLRCLGEADHSKVRVLDYRHQEIVKVASNSGRDDALCLAISFTPLYKIAIANGY